MEGTSVSTTFPTRAFILAAGRGTRLSAYTDTLPQPVPKPLVHVRGKPILDHTLDRLEDAGIRQVTINIHHLADQITGHLANRTSPQITFSYETDLLETGGGIKKALHTMGNEAFFCFSGDTLWEDGPSGNTLRRMASAWDDQTMDLLLLLQPLDRMTVTHGSGDYDLGPDGRPFLSPTKSGLFFWPSIRIVHPRLFDNSPDGPFSFLELMKKAEQTGRIAAVRHDGVCYHITSKSDLDEVNAHFLHPSGLSVPDQAGPKVA